MRADNHNAGLISAPDFADIMKTTKQHLLTPFVRENLVVVRKISFCLSLLNRKQISNQEGWARGAKIV